MGFVTRPYVFITTVWKISYPFGQYH